MGALAWSAIVIAVLCWFYLSKTRPDEKVLSAAEDGVYEAVVRDIVTPTHGQASFSQLVFYDTLETYLTNGSDMKSCEESARKHLRLESNSPPEFNSLADKIYRFFTRGWYDSSLRAVTIQDFLVKSCTVGRLPTTFHTDLPRALIAPESVHFRDWPSERDKSTTFEELFPGASGIISFSHVGFDPNFHEAIVSTSFICGGLCGAGRTYVLKKIWGRWEVANKWIVWVS